MSCWSCSSSTWPANNSAYAGLLAAAIGLGSMLGGLGSVVLAGRSRLGPSVLVGAAVSGIPIVILGIGPRLAVAAVVLVGYGVGKSIVTVATQTLLHRTVSDTVAARVFGVQEGVIQAGMAAGALLGSPAGPDRRGRKSRSSPPGCSCRSPP